LFGSTSLALPSDEHVGASHGPTFVLGLGGTQSEFVVHVMLNALEHLLLPVQVPRLTWLQSVFV
jgi:hypothetical protein